jgi:predicted ATPase
VGGHAVQLMVGRDRELARVTGVLDDVLAGRGRLVLCTGEAGIGKTRLAEELAAAAEARDVPVAWARASDQGSSPPYGLWRLVLDEPAVAARPSVFGAALGPDLGADSGIAQRFALFAEVRGRLAQAASRRGLVLVLDDLQWADEASAVLLVEVVRQLRGTRILAFATYRDSPGGVLAGLSAEVNTERVDLHGLPPEAVGDLLLAAGLDAPPERARRVHDETGGNPFLVRELAQSLSEPSGASVPGRVVEATAYRLAQLSGEARAVLQAAAVAGNTFSAGVVAKMLDVPVLSLLGPLEGGHARAGHGAFRRGGAAGPRGVQAAQ